MAAVDDSLLDAFDRDGFVVVEDFFDATELELFGSIVDRAVKDRVGEDSRSMDDKSLYEQSFQQCMNLWEDNPALKELTFSQKLGEVAASLLGATALRIWHDQALYKKAWRTGNRPSSGLAFVAYGTGKTNYGLDPF